MSAPTPPTSGFSQFFAEMKRRHVVRFALGYAAVAFVVLQLAEIIFPAFDIGETGVRILVVAVALLFPPALVAAWIFDLTPKGIERTERAPGAAKAGVLPRLALLGVTVAIMGSLGAWLLREGVLDEPAGAPSVVSEPALVAYVPGAPIRSLAVLPLQDFSGGGGEDYFTAGMQEELIAQLSQVPGLRVVSRTSVRRLAEADLSIPSIGRELQVDAVVEGSVRRSGEQIRITVQLIHAASDSHIWTKQYDRAMENVLALQSEVALDIARQIQAELSPQETSVLQQVATRSVDPDAQDAYLRGRYEAEKGTPEGLQAARDLFETAVREDSSFAPALAGLAGTRFLLGLGDSAVSPEQVALARVEAERALSLDGASQEAQEVLSLIRQMLPGAGSQVVVTRAPPPPGTPDTAWFQAMSQLGRRIEERMRSKGAVVTHDADMGRFMGARGLMTAGHFTDAVDMLSTLVEDAPEMGMAWELLVRAEISSGNPQGAVDVLGRWSTAGGEGAPTAAEVRTLEVAVSKEGAGAFWRWQLARLEASRAAGAHVPPMGVAAARAGTGDVDGAFQALEEALASRDRGLALLQKDPVWDGLRADSRFADLVRRSRSMHLERSVRGSPGLPRRR